MVHILSGQVKVPAIFVTRHSSSLTSYKRSICVTKSHDATLQYDPALVDFNANRRRRSKGKRKGKRETDRKHAIERLVVFFRHPHVRTQELGTLVKFITASDRQSRIPVPGKERARVARECQAAEQT